MKLVCTSHGSGYTAENFKSVAASHGRVTWQNPGLACCGESITKQLSVVVRPVLDHLRNDMALLLATNRHETLALLPIPGEPAGTSAPAEEPPSEFLDCIVGMWEYSREMVAAVEALAEPTRSTVTVEAPPDRPEPPRGSILR